MKPFALAIIDVETGRFADAASSQRLVASMREYLDGIASAEDLVTQTGPSEFGVFLAEAGKPDVERFIRCVIHTSELLAAANLDSVELVVWVGVSRHAASEDTIDSLMTSALSNRIQVCGPSYELLTA